MLVKRLPSVRTIDGREVSMDERDHVEMLFAPAEVAQQSQQIGPYVTATGVGQERFGGGKVPIKLTSMNFESLVVPHRDALPPPSVRQLTRSPRVERRVGRMKDEGEVKGHGH
jgi:hypothetical protein